MSRNRSRLFPGYNFFKFDCTIRVVPIKFHNSSLSELQGWGHTSACVTHWHAQILTHTNTDMHINGHVYKDVCDTGTQYFLQRCICKVRARSSKAQEKIHSESIWTTLVDACTWALPASVSTPPKILPSFATTANPVKRKWARNEIAGWGFGPIVCQLMLKKMKAILCVFYIEQCKSTAV